jgi:hypothetical protein
MNMRDCALLFSSEARNAGNVMLAKKTGKIKAASGLPAAFILVRLV